MRVLDVRLECFYQRVIPLVLDLTGPVLMRCQAAAAQKVLHLILRLELPRHSVRAKLVEREHTFMLQVGLAFSRVNTLRVVDAVGISWMELVGKRGVPPAHDADANDATKQLLGQAC